MWLRWSRKSKRLRKTGKIRIQEIQFFLKMGLTYSVIGDKIFNCCRCVADNKKKKKPLDKLMVFY